MGSEMCIRDSLPFMPLHLSKLQRDEQLLNLPELPGCVRSRPHSIHTQELSLIGHTPTAPCSQPLHAHVSSWSGWLMRSYGPPLVRDFTKQVCRSAHLLSHARSSHNGPHSRTVHRPPTPCACLCLRCAALVPRRRRACSSRSWCRRVSVHEPLHAHRQQLGTVCRLLRSVGGRTGSLRSTSLGSRSPVSSVLSVENPPSAGGLELAAAS